MKQSQPPQVPNKRLLEGRQSKELTGSTLPWTLVPYSKKVVEGWNRLFQESPENAHRCHQWLSDHPMKAIPKLCFALKHKHHSGCWCYDIGGVARIYYKPDESLRSVTVYYAGPHPSDVPYPPHDGNNE